MAQTVVAPKITIPRSPEWMKWRIGGARQGAINIASDSRPFINSARDLQQHRVWEVYFTDEPKTWERFCREVINTEPEFVALIDRGVRVLEQRDHQGPIPKEAALAAAAETEQPQPMSGEIGNGRSRRDIITPTQRGTQTAYLIRRIKRDRPDILEKIKRGEYKSARAAAIDAGIIKQQTTVEKMRRLWTRATEEEREEFLVWIGPNAD